MFITALIAALTLSAEPAPFELKTTRLKNGLSVSRVKYGAKGLVSYYSVVRVGSRNEVEPGKTGFAHFFEHVMFKGTPKWPEGTRDAMLAGNGFNENAFTSDDVTVYHVSGPSSHLGKLVEVEADRFANLSFSESTFQTEAKAVLGEYHKNAANPGLKIEETVLGAAFKTHPYRHTTLGFYDDIKAMPSQYEYAKQFFKRWYTPDNTMVFVVGDFDDTALMADIEKHYGGWKGTVASVVIPPEPAQTSAKLATVNWTTPTLPRLGMFWKVPAASLTGTDDAAATIAADYLAGETSPLFKALVLDDQLAEQVRPDYSAHRDPTLFGIVATLKDEKHRAQVATAVENAVKELAAGKVDRARVQSILDHNRYGFIMGLETSDRLALELAYAAGVRGVPDALLKAHQASLKVKAEDLVAFAKKRLVDTQKTSLVFTVDAPGATP